MYFNIIHMIDGGEKSQFWSFLKVEQAPACNGSIYFLKKPQTTTKNKLKKTTQNLLLHKGVGNQFELALNVGFPSTWTNIKLSQDSGKSPSSMFYGVFPLPQVNQEYSLPFHLGKPVAMPTDATAKWFPLK